MTYSANRQCAYCSAALHQPAADRPTSSTGPGRTSRPPARTPAPRLLMCTRAQTPCVTCLAPHLKQYVPMIESLDSGVLSGVLSGCQWQFRNCSRNRQWPQGKRNAQISRNLRILEKCARRAQISRNFFRKRGAPKFRKKNCEILGWGKLWLVADQLAAQCSTLGEPLMPFIL